MHSGGMGKWKIIHGGVHLLPNILQIFVKQEKPPEKSKKIEKNQENPRINQKTIPKSIELMV